MHGDGNRRTFPRMNDRARRFALAAALFVALGSPSAGAAGLGDGGSNCPAWVDGTPVECWVPQVTYRENIALLHDDPPVYLTKIERLVESEHTFDTRAELEAYVQTVLIVRGFWIEHPLRGRILVPPSAFDHVEAVQIIDPPRRLDLDRSRY